ncbi:MAG: dTDP-4-dehydrorhamnose reductase, partial [Deltaproteobacteria bacterium]
QSTPYVETDAPNPQSVYGRTKLAGEEAIVESGLEKYYIIRTSWLYGPDGNNFVETVLRLATEREEMWIVADQVGTPTHTGDLADAVFALLNSCADYGVYHFADEGQCSWYDFACAIVAEGRGFGLPLKVREIHPITTEDYPLPAKRPVNSVFDKGKYKAATGLNIPGWRASLHRYFPQREIKS